ncbi:hypothetical protein OSB04_009165 [Centaurea solstitialis]|uniref:Bet v I/Major latex protein domain-containing protein n=1 Tax=Centaurea solstitialis TaxID=347529 RepID=A0AA38WRU7_9ASTR|nr:hypothetical protein OSB04_009165 [Centaurea solstitialis]
MIPNKGLIPILHLFEIMVMYLDINSRGDVFHHIFRRKPHEFASVSPDKIHGCNIDGKLGILGSILCWNYTVGIVETIIMY